MNHHRYRFVALFCFLNQAYRMGCYAVSVVLFLSLGMLMEAYAQKPSPPSKGALPLKPKLVVAITIDQLRGDYFDRYRHFFSSEASGSASSTSGRRSFKKNPVGFNRLIEDGAWFSESYYPFINTVTAVGHQAIYSGVLPARSGIVGNDWFHRGEQRHLYCVEDPGAETVGSAPENKRGKMSPRNAEVENVFDALRTERPASRVYGIAVKDRGAILPAGKRANAAYWFDSNEGIWISSDYYFPKKTLPKWVESFNKKRPADKFLNTTWTKVLSDSEYLFPDDGLEEGVIPGDDNSLFPHFIRDLAASNNPLTRRNGRYDAIPFTPHGNDLTVDFAIELIEKEKMGRGKETDVIAISFSSLDYCGHVFGPDSQEIQDMMIRLDVTLARLFTYLDKAVGRESYLVTLSSDHGVAPIPEQDDAKSKGGLRLSMRAFRDSLKAGVNSRFPGAITEVMNNDIYFNREVIKQKAYPIDDIDMQVKETLKRFSFIRRAFTKEEIANRPMKQTQEDTVKWLMSGSLHPERSGDVIFELIPYAFFMSSKGTTHGTLQTYDRHVPLCFWGKGIRAAKHATPSSPLDCAATLHALLGLKEQRTYDGINQVERLTAP